MNEKKLKEIQDPKIAFIEHINHSNHLGLNRWEKERFKLSLTKDTNGQWTLTDSKIGEYLRKRVVDQDKSFKHTAEKYLYEAVRHTMLELMLFDEYAHPTFKALSTHIIKDIQQQLIELSIPSKDNSLSSIQISKIITNAFQKARENALVPQDENERWYQEYVAICNGYGWHEKSLEWKDEPTGQEVHDQFLGEIPLSEKFQGLVLNQLQKKTSLKYHGRKQLDALVTGKHLARSIH